MFGNGNYGGEPVFIDALFAKNLIVTDDITLHRSFSAFRADFASPTNFVQLLMGGFSNGDPPYLAALDSQGHVLAECLILTYANGPCGVPLSDEPPTMRPWMVSLATGADNIAFILAGGVAAGTRIASMTFGQTSVPEPPALALLALGLIGLVGVHLGKRHRVR